MVVLAWVAFDIPLHYGALAVFLTFFLALVACRATGDTDITPIGAMGKIMQLTYGAADSAELRGQPHDRVDHVQRVRQRRRTCSTI